MENLIYATFSDEKSATEGFKQLQDLDQLGDITIYAIALIRKDENDRYSVLQHEGAGADDMPAKGALAGTLVGALAGPLGMAIGMLTGVMAGSLDEDEFGEVTQQFLDKVQKRLAPGELAIVMDAEEDTDFMINSYLSSYKGTIVRSPIDEAYDANDRAEWDELDAEIEESKKELAVAAGDEKARIQSKIDKLKEKQTRLKDQIKEKAQQRKKEWERKMQALDKKIGHAKDKAKEKFKARQEKLRKDWDEYNKAVDQAFA